MWTAVGDSRSHCSSNEDEVQWLGFCNIHLSSDVHASWAPKPGKQAVLEMQTTGNLSVSQFFHVKFQNTLGKLKIILDNSLNCWFKFSGGIYKTNCWCRKHLKCYHPIQGCYYPPWNATTVKGSATTLTGMLSLPLECYHSHPFQGSLN
jgi:hypothetical protein